MYLPLMSSGQVRAVLVIKLLNEKTLDLAQRTLLESFTALMTVMIQKDQLLKISREAKMKEETQNLQSALFDNLSHELKYNLNDYFRLFGCPGFISSVAQRCHGPFGRMPSCLPAVDERSGCGFGPDKIGYR